MPNTVDNEHFIDAADIVMFVKRKDEESFKTLGCTSEDGFNGTRDSKEISNKCTAGSKITRPGDLGWTFTSSGNAIDEDLEPSFVSYKTLMDIFLTGEIVRVKFASPDGKYYREGDAWLSSYNETANNGDTLLGFNLTWTGIGKPITEPETT